MRAMKTYMLRGSKDGNWTVHVSQPTQATYPLPLYLDHVNHSPDGFAWGYNGSAPAQLAYAMLMDAIGNRDIVRQYYMRFKDTIIAGHNKDVDHNISEMFVRDWVIYNHGRIPA